MLKTSYFSPTFFKCALQWVCVGFFIFAPWGDGIFFLAPASLFVRKYKKFGLARQNKSGSMMLCGHMTAEIDEAG